MKRKPKTQTFNSVKEFLSANREYVYERIRAEYAWYHIDLKEMAIDYMAYAEQRAKLMFVGEIETKKINDMIFRNVGYWRTYRKMEGMDAILKKNNVAYNDFKEERERAAWATLG